MASAQQKPKKERGARNSKRHNGKALKQDVAIIQEPSWVELPRDRNEKDSEKILVLERMDTYSTPRYGKDGNKLTGKGRATGKSFLGVSIKRLQAQANARTWPPGVDGLEVVKAELREKRERRNETRKMFARYEIQRQVEQSREALDKIRNRGSKPVSRATAEQKEAAA